MIGKINEYLTKGVLIGIDRIGYASIGGGFGLWISHAYDSSVDMMSYILPSWPQEWPEWAAAASCLGAFSFIIKNIVEAYVNFKNRNISRADNDAD